MARLLLHASSMMKQIDEPRSEAGDQCSTISDEQLTNATGGVRAGVGVGVGVMLGCGVGIGANGPGAGCGVFVGAGGGIGIFL
jgi:hypothetical protein